MRAPTLQLGLGGMVIDGFAGGGGASTGIERAGLQVDVAINHDPEALAMHAANHPETRHLCGDIWDANPREVTGGRPVAFAWFSPTCFPAGTLVLTKAGMVPVEHVAVGTEVLTHRNRWRTVTATSTRVAETVTLRGQGHYGLVTTPDHKFYSKRVTHRNTRTGGGGNDPSTPRRTLIENPYWPEAATMVGKRWATPVAFPDSAIPTTEGASFSDDFFYFVGRWLGDGLLNKGDVEVCTGAADFEAMKAIFAAAPLRRASGEVVLPREVHRTASCPSLAWGNAPLGRWLEENFGALSEGKRLPVWALSMQRSWREALLRGYVDADGNISDGVTSTLSVSRRLSVAVRLLAASLGHAACLYKVDGRPGTIEGRSFVGRDSYKVNWRAESARPQPLRDANHMFALVKEVASTGRAEEVFCLEVEEDHSYVADGIVVHNCTHFSRAKGGPLKDAKTRSLAWVVHRWMREVRPAVVALENVVEFQTWGRLLNDGTIDPRFVGHTFKTWLGKIRALGYQVEMRELSACDFGAPTTRRRLFIIARCDGRPIVWPAPTHGRGLQPHRTAGECIDWSLPCPSIFDRPRPLVEATLRRIAHGLRKFVTEAPEPYLVDVAGRRAAASMVQVSYGERVGQAPRVLDIRQPLGTVVAGGVKHALVAAFVAKNFGGNGTPGGSLQLPLSTVTCKDHHSLVEVAVSPGQEQPERVRAFLVQFNGTSNSRSLQLPLGTITTRDRFGLTTVHGAPIVDIGFRMLTPRELATAQGFGPDYVLDPVVGGKGRGRGPGHGPLRRLGPSAQVRMIGNSVSPHVAEAIVRANVRADVDEVAA